MKIVARCHMLVARIMLNWERYRAASIKEKRIHCRKKRQQEKSVIAEANDSMNHNDMWRFYRTVNGAWLCALIERWKFFQQLLKDDN